MEVPEQCNRSIHPYQNDHEDGQNNQGDGETGLHLLTKESLEVAVLYGV